MYPVEANPQRKPTLSHDFGKEGVFFIGPVESPQTSDEKTNMANIAALLFRVEDVDKPGNVAYHLPIAVRRIFLQCTCTM